MGQRYDLNHSRDMSSHRRYGGSLESLRCVICGSEDFQTRVSLAKELKKADGLRPIDQAYLCPACALDGTKVTMDRLLASGYWTLESNPEGEVEMLEEPDLADRPGKEYWVLGFAAAAIVGAVAWALGRD